MTAQNTIDEIKNSEEYLGAKELSCESTACSILKQALLDEVTKRLNEKIITVVENKSVNDIKEMLDLL